MKVALMYTCVTVVIFVLFNELTVAHVDLDVRPSNNGSNPIVECPVCLGGVAGARFAAHLEK